jgi:hypothetical protein
VVAAWVLGGLVAGATCRSARAAAPPCFPERTVSESISLRDDHSQVFGGLRAGQVVQVRDQPADGSGTWADIEIARPIAVHGRTDRRKLVVFARADIEAQPGLAWLLAGAPLWVVSGDQQRARVVVAAPLNERPLLPAVEVSCALLRGTAPPDIVGWDELGPLQKGRDQVAGAPVDWDGTRELESDTGAQSIPLNGGDRLLDGRRNGSILVKQEGARALVEVVDHFNWVRHRGWTSRDGLRFEPTKVPDVICGCAEGAGWLLMTFPERPRGRLKSAAALRSVADNRPFATLPVGESVIALAVRGDDSLVVWTLPVVDGQVGPDPQQVLFGLVPTDAIAGLSASRVNAVVTGRANLRRHGAPYRGPVVVHARWGHGGVSFETHVSPAPDGSFRLTAPVNRGSLSICLQDNDGEAFWTCEYVHPRAGKVVRVNLRERAH